MKLSCPSTEFDEVIAAVCHGTATETEMRALNELLRSNPAARDSYLFQVELHSRLASNPDLFCDFQNVSESRAADRENVIALPPVRAKGKGRLMQTLAAAACLALVAGGIALFKWSQPGNASTNTPVAMLTRTVDARWGSKTHPPRVGSALEKGTFQLQSGLAQIVFYSGARLAMEGPVELRLVSENEAVCVSGRVLAEVPAPARGFRLRTGQLSVVDLGTSFGVNASHSQTEVHVFKGKVELLPGKTGEQSLAEGQAALIQGSDLPQLMAASPEAFSSMFEFQELSLASEALRYDQWRLSSAQLNRDPSLVLRFDFDNLDDSDWTLANKAARTGLAEDGVIVGCQRAEGRWREKTALEFQSVNDRVRLVVPNEFRALTLSVWVCLKGLDRDFNSLFMSDGFDAGTVHWLIRRDGVLGLTLFGPRFGKFQIVASPPVPSLENLGVWQHLAVVIDGRAHEVVHYVNGLPVGRHTLKLDPPFRVGSAELGNWNARSGPDPEPSLIRNLSGSLDEFELFSRALTDAEIRDLYLKGKPEL
ncbi:MAG TPA: LamG-like jellyroll fold domain-containing protein [Verrucomicrobiae bacterium]|nr:LamG-like jellyroll fold domain-containing protein [Verrucomicrobiae bacterium]